jgi:alpha-N-arabinofuranosidase
MVMNDSLRSPLPCLAVCLAVSLATGAPAGAENARIKLDLDRTVGEVDPLLYGNFVEHLGRMVYGGIYEPGSPLSDELGLRQDVMAAIRELNPTILRYPGGNFVSNYHWMDGVGPERKAQIDLAWDVLEPNTFGTDEFMQFVRQAGAEPYFTVNMGTGTIEEAQEWVVYTNIAEGPWFAELRKQHGFPEPYGIKYWSLGNEMDGFWQIGHLNAEDYTKKALEAAKMMRGTDPGISLIAAGSSNYRPDADPMRWNRVVLEGLRNVVDYIALHIYVGNPDDDYYNFMSTPLVMEQRTDLVRGLIKEVMLGADRGDRPPIYIAWDEYNVWYRARSGDHLRGREALEERYNLEDALVIAGFLNGFVRNADVVKMANMAQLVNVIAPIFTSPEGMFKQTIFYPLALFANNVYGTSLDVHVSSDSYDTEEFFIGLGEQTTTQKDVPYLDVSATHQQDGTLIVNAVNRHRDQAIATDVIAQEGVFRGPFEVYEVTGPDVKAQNDFEQERVRTTRKPDLAIQGDAFTYSFPPHSFTMLKGRIER